MYEREIEAIEEARKAMRPRVSQRRAAQLAGMSESWWRHLIKGGYNQGSQWVPAQASEQMVLDMARAVGIDREVTESLGIPYVPRPMPSVEIRDDAERIIWSIEELSETERRGLIAYHRAQREMASHPRD